MRKLLLPVVLILFGVVVTGCGAPPPLLSNTYLNDRSLLSEDPCGPPCFQEITIGKTTFADALNRVRGKEELFSNVQSQDNPAQAAWATKDGVACCQMTANADTGLVDAILLRVAPVMTVEEVIKKYGPPAYVSVLAEPYSDTEVAMGLVYPETGNVIWIMPGDMQSTVDETDPVVVVLYLDPGNFDDLLATATLQGWLGYRPYQEYLRAEPILTPRVTVTPAQ